MKVVQINATCGAGSTGKIAVELSRAMTARGMENYILYSYEGTDYPLGIANASLPYIKLQALKTRILGNYGFNSQYATKKLTQKLRKIQPDVVHLHNLGGHDCNFTMLFSYFRQQNIPVLWTFHDCLAFTGLCPYFGDCRRWKTLCEHCPKWREKSWFRDGSTDLYLKKQQAFRDLNLTIAAPSRWMADLVQESFLRDYPVRVIPNGIDLQVFTPRESDFRKKYQLEDAFLILGVAFQWEERKGLDVFLELARRLEPPFRLLLVGTDKKVDRLLPPQVISIHRTASQKELAEIYTAADLFLNPTREDNYPTVNMEAMACGTPVLTFRTGGSPESIGKNCGAVVETKDPAAVEAAIRRIREERPFRKEDCLLRSRSFDSRCRTAEYIALYEEMAGSRSLPEKEKAYAQHPQGI